MVTIEFSDLLRNQAEQVFGDRVKAAVWLRQPRSSFNGRCALEFVQDEASYLLAKETLDRLEHGFAW
ncbi:MbcA/ParS/Xre antitoxin family protein [Pseudomonas fontis]|uniref:MbcA/ParS/Xre antitoxin family protein n=1 Tax=Pseudomonas fontis TaxID=2942633 RepID=A0ABT5NTD8_9PSED|nr:MbcA/ParS/Xre antitoxin family protein [Pseudomonas fontis]MDD0976909.1 MbcA/ParS/Xre antitoxin family protein [Pseudomonas fontis]MDD0991442.1 MbcA/ParS/Xre antitoxin family protein [Pseudomonas fontis]